MRTFTVEVRWDGQVVAGVSAITPLRNTVEVVTVREGGSGAVYKLPGRVDTAQFRIERGVGDDLAFDLWASGPDLRKDVEVRLLDASDGLTVSYVLRGCWVCEYAVAPDIATGVVMESLSLSVNSWRRVTPPPSMLAERFAERRAGVVRRVHLAGLLTGSTEQTVRQLDTVLRQAQEAGATLLFDEADALFGRRAQLLDAGDRYERTEVDGVLDRLAAFQGHVLVVAPDDE